MVETHLLWRAISLVNIILGWKSSAPKFGTTLRSKKANKCGICDPLFPSDLAFSLGNAYDFSKR